MPCQHTLQQAPPRSRSQTLGAHIHALPCVLLRVKAADPLKTGGKMLSHISSAQTALRKVTLVRVPQREHAPSSSS